MEFPFGQTVFRDRRKRIPDPYNPDRFTLGPWETADTIELQGAFVASSSSTSRVDATRTQILTEKSLYCQPDDDVEALDRIRVDGVKYYVQEQTTADVNPWTGWQPVREVPLSNKEG